MHERRNHRLLDHELPGHHLRPDRRRATRTRRPRDPRSSREGARDYQGHAITDTAPEQPQKGAQERKPMTVNNTASPPSRSVDDVLAARYHHEATDLEYRHRPHVIRQIIADELAGLEQRRTNQQQDPTSKENRDV